MYSSVPLKSPSETCTDHRCSSSKDKASLNISSKSDAIELMLLKNKKHFYAFLALVGCVSLLGVICLAVGVYHYQASLASSDEKCKPTSGSGGEALKLNQEQQKLGELLNKVKRDYFKLYPNEVYADPEVGTHEIIDHFLPYDPNWKTLKSRTDHALKLRQELKDLNIDGSKLRPREKKALAQAEHYLESIFGNPYDENYYAGDWMMGPNYFCWQQICYMPSSLNYHFNKDGGFVPKDLTGIEKIFKAIKRMKTTLETYQGNMVLGVKSGMVRSVEDCAAGYNAFAVRFPNTVQYGPIGVLNESFSSNLIDPSFYDDVNEDDKRRFGTKFNNQSITSKTADILVQYLGTPLHEFMEFLKNNHSRHCVPSDVASGLANLPLKYVWLDQNQTDIETTQQLPTGERLSGPKSYEMILPYFTTSKEYNATSIYLLGEQQKAKLYERAKEIAMKITNQTKTKAIETFKTDLNHPRHFFNTTPIPDNENGEIGGKRCRNMEEAKQNCPVRYEAMQAWFRYAQQIIAKLNALTVNMFYMAGERLTTPVCPIRMVAKFNPSSGSQSYSGGGSRCGRASYYKLPFFASPGPKYNAFSVAGHETRPGHHTQVQGFSEHFSSSGKNDVIDWLNGITYYTAFTEGWALYAENPLLSTETNLYDDEPYQEYGMLKWQIWRALRLIVDTGLHARGMTMNEALNDFEMFAWDTTDKAYKDTIRYMSDPGQATAYMIGQLAIWRMRNETENSLRHHNVTFNEKEFHYQILSQGSSPLHYLQSYMKDYVQCKINSQSRDDCQEILEPKKANQPSAKFSVIGTKKRWEYIARARAQQSRDHHD